MTVGSPASLRGGPPTRRRVLIVVQRYGAEVVGGSEAHARLAAQRLSLANDVEVATSTALDHWTWEPHYAPGVGELDGIPVRRFPVIAGRRPDFKELERRVLFDEHTVAEELAWPRWQGPHVPDLYEFLHQEGTRYQAVLFWTYIYAPTALGLPLVPERAALVPTTHDEAPLDLAPYRQLFQLPRAFGFLTPEERALVHRRFMSGHIPDEVLGIAMAPPPLHDPVAFRRAYGIEGPLVAYVGQVSEAKACDELLRGWIAWREGRGAGTLALAGERRMELPDRPDVLALGRVTDEEKFALLAAADALVLPSHLESLGIVLLEAWQVGTPVVVPAWNAVTAGQTARSGGGVAYRTPDALGDALDAVLPKARALGESGRGWVERETTLEAFDARLQRLVDLAAFDA